MIHAVVVTCLARMQNDPNSILYYSLIHELVWVIDMHQCAPSNGNELSACFSSKS